MSDSVSMAQAAITTEHSALARGLSKVPALTLGFWVIKIIATTLGEVGGNAVTLTANLGYLTGCVIFGIPLVLAVAVQIRSKRFNSYLYWTVITLTTLAGTTLADFFDRSLGIGYAGGSLALFALVLVSLAFWYRTLGTVDIKTVTNPKTETFYWITIMFSQTLGTALGDWMSDATPLGYNGSAALIGAVLVGLAGLFYFTNFSRTTLFWTAFILTRPLGATFANCFDKPVEKGSLGISDYTMTAVFAGLMVICLLFIPQRASDNNH